ncbi:hypothetical protein [Bradyrhizobium sp. 930_D9_N1_4]|uniref:hypothetical protein n=1 Tax=Bradyrhizobium sp. 930_D9_N1_4 TaxID=3240374 RepID=UPI003F8CC837
MSIVTDFKSIARKLNCQEQKAEFEEKNPPAPDWYSQLAAGSWPYGVAAPLVATESELDLNRLDNGKTEGLT